jgi:hypothetical protein
MRVIETTAHVGPDGMLRLEVPLEQRSQDVRVAVVVEWTPTQQPNPTDDRWASVRTRLAGTGIRVPPPGVDNCGPVDPVDLPGPSASEILINDRR